MGDKGKGWVAEGGEAKGVEWGRLRLCVLCVWVCLWGFCSVGFRDVRPRRGGRTEGQVTELPACINDAVDWSYGRQEDNKNAELRRGQVVETIERGRGGEGGGPWVSAVLNSNYATVTAG